MKTKTSTDRKFKMIAEAFLAIPGLIFIIFAVGEISGGIAGGLEHIIQVILVIIFALTGWFYPKKFGVILIAASVIFSILYFLSFSGLSLLSKLINEVILFLPPLLSGIFFVLASKKS